MPCSQSTWRPLWLLETFHSPKGPVYPVSRSGRLQKTQNPSITIHLPTWRASARRRDFHQRLARPLLLILSTRVLHCLTWLNFDLCSLEWRSSFSFFCLNRTWFPMTSTLQPQMCVLTLEFIWKKVLCCYAITSFSPTSNHYIQKSKYYFLPQTLPWQFTSECLLFSHPHVPSLCKSSKRSTVMRVARYSSVEQSSHTFPCGAELLIESTNHALH